MARVNRLGLSGTTYWRRQDGTLTSVLQDVFIHIDRIIVNLDRDLLKVRFGVWSTKAEYKNGLAQLDVLGDISPEYVIDNRIKVKKGRDKHSGDDVQTAFDFIKPNAGQDFLLVKVDGETKILGTDYTISYAEGDSGIGTVTFTEPPVSGVENIHLIRLVGAYDEYFSPHKTKNLNKDHFVNAVAFLKTLDGTDEWDVIKIDFSSFVEDDAA